MFLICRGNPPGTYATGWQRQREACVSGPVRLIFPLDGSQPVEQLVRLLTVALDGQRPVERDVPDADYFVDGGVQFGDAQVRVRLSVCAFGDCRVIHSWSGTYATALGATLIAALVADAVAPHVKLDADLKAPQE